MPRTAKIKAFNEESVKEIEKQLPKTLPTYVLPDIPEPRNSGDSRVYFLKKKKQDDVVTRGKRLFESFVNDPKLSTTGYLAKCLRVDGKLDGNIKIGKPRPKGYGGDFTTNSDGPYTYNLFDNTCTCPFFKSDTYCKHQIGILLWLAHVPYTLTSKGYIVWETTLEEATAE